MVKKLPFLSKLRKAVVVATAGLAVAGSIGCHSSYNGYRYNHCLDRYIARKRAMVQAWYVWNQCSDHCDSECYRDFRRGFIDGYCDIALGGNGCTPVVPPNRYWGWRYQDEMGQQQIAAWYQGYPAGVNAANQVGNYYEIPTTVPAETPDYESFRNEFYSAYKASESGEAIVETPKVKAIEEVKETVKSADRSFAPGAFSPSDFAPIGEPEVPTPPQPPETPISVTPKTPVTVEEPESLDAALDALTEEVRKRAAGSVSADPLK